MSLHTVILVNAFLDLGAVLAVAAVIANAFALDRRREPAAVYSFATALPEELAA